MIQSINHSLWWQKGKLVGVVRKYMLWTNYKDILSIISIKHQFHFSFAMVNLASIMICTYNGFIKCEDCARAVTGFISSLCISVCVAVCSL